MNVDQFIEDIQKNQWNVFGVEVYTDGQLSCSYGDTTATRYPVYSATKTITSIAAGMAMDDGVLDLERSVLDYLPGEIVARLPRRQLSAFRPVTIERLLTMSVVGFPFRPSGESWLTEALECRISRRCEFDYSNFSAYLVGVAATCALGEDLYNYLQKRLFTPLGIETPPFARCPDGYFYGASSMELTVNELSRVGLLLYSGGEYNGQRLLSESYVQRATSVQQHNREGGYGYFVWKYRSGFSINGKWKQKCYVLPEDGLMITFLSHIEEENPHLIRSMERNILGIQ